MGKLALFSPKKEWYFCVVLGTSGLFDDLGEQEFQILVEEKPQDQVPCYTQTVDL